MRLVASDNKQTALDLMDVVAGEGSAGVSGDVCANDRLSAACGINPIAHGDQERLALLQVAEWPIRLCVGIATNPDGPAINLVEHTH